MCIQSPEKTGINDFFFYFYSHRNKLLSPSESFFFFLSVYFNVIFSRVNERAVQSILHPFSRMSSQYSCKLQNNALHSYNSSHINIKNKATDQTSLPDQLLKPSNIYKYNLKKHPSTFKNCIDFTLKIPLLNHTVACTHVLKNDC